MKKLSLLLCLVLAVSVAPSFAHAKKTEKAPAGNAADMSPEQKAQMEKMMALMTPNENHRALDPFVGHWKQTMRFWMAPDAKPEQSVGSTMTKWVMDGRFVQMDVKGTSMGKPFKGLGIVGFDNVRKEYSSIWLDNMATGIMVSSSTYDAANKTFHEKGDASCPMTGEAHRAIRSDIKWIDKDHYSYEMYLKDPNGKEYKGMEIQYERADKTTPKMSKAEKTH